MSDQNDNEVSPLEYFRALVDKAEKEGSVALTVEDLNAMLFAVMAELGKNMVDTMEQEVMSDLREERDEAIHEFKNMTVNK